MLVNRLARELGFMHADRSHGSMNRPAYGFEDAWEIALVRPLTAPCRFPLIVQSTQSVYLEPRQCDDRRGTMEFRDRERNSGKSRRFLAVWNFAAHTCHDSTWRASGSRAARRRSATSLTAVGPIVMSRPLFVVSLKSGNVSGTRRSMATPSSSHRARGAEPRRRLRRSTTPVDPI
jgi:hypothetical protein